MASRSALVLVASFAVGLLLTAGSAFAASASGRAVFPRLALGAARSSADGCGKNGVVCSVVNAPLDRTGGVAGTVALHVEVLPARGTQRGVIFLVAGGPGQGSAQTFDLARPLSAFLFRFLFPGYTLVAYDDRGTGRSGHLDCPSLASATSDQSMTSVVADCAAQLGPERAFYSTADHAADLESVRQALGFGQIAIYGVSYGTKLAVAYAAAYPQNVSRLLLDSVLPPDDSDPFASRILQSMPTTLAGYCPSDWCAGATPDFGADVVAVANQLAASPLQARVREPNGRTTPVTLPALAFLSMVTDADLNPGLAAELPAAVHAARDGDPQPLLHAYQLESVSRGQSNDFSDTLFLATVCDDGPLPWQSDTPVEDRPASMQAALGALPAGSFGPFGSWAAAFGNVAMCTGWPDAGGAVRPLAGPLPDVPVLAISGGLDLRTPTAGAASVIARFPHGHLLLVPGVGHSVLTADASGCSQNAVRQWVLKNTTPANCSRILPFVSPLAAFPVAHGTHLDPSQTRQVAAKTLRDAEAVWLATAGVSGSRASVAGIYGGTMVASARAFSLVKYSIAPGVNISGRVQLTKVGPPLAFKGNLHVDGGSASPGRLALGNGTLRGRLGNRNVGP